MSEFFPILIKDLKVGENFTFTGGYCFSTITFHYDIDFDSDDNANIHFII